MEHVTERATGGCLCGAVRIEARGKPLRVGVCHCLDCRKNSGSLFYAGAIFPEDAVTVSGEVGEYQGRCFCTRCGSTVFGRSEGEVEVTLGTLDAASQFKPTYELWCDRREDWLPAFEGTVRYARDREG